MSRIIKYSKSDSRRHSPSAVACWINLSYILEISTRFWSTLSWYSFLFQETTCYSNESKKRLLSLSLFLSFSRDTVCIAFLFALIVLLLLVAERNDRVYSMEWVSFLVSNDLFKCSYLKFKIHFILGGWDRKFDRRDEIYLVRLYCVYADFQY